MSLTRSKAVLELGKRLVAQLGEDEDLLARWMAHHIAERIEAAKKAPPKGKTAAQDSCAKAILELWRHRNALPAHLRPLGELEPVLRTLALLDVDRTDFRYYPPALRDAATANADEETKQWLEFAIGLDYTARLLIQFALRSAAQRAGSTAEPWIALALQAGEDEGTEAPIATFALGIDDAGGVDEDRRNAALRDKLSRLESFADLATRLAEILRSQMRGPQGAGRTSDEVERIRSSPRA